MSIRVSSLGKTIGSDLQSIAQAISLAASTAHRRIELHLSPGIYRLTEPVVIASDLGWESLTISGGQRDSTIICGSVLLDVQWSPYRGEIYAATVADDLDIDMLYVNGKQYHMARYPDYNERERVLQGYAPDCLAPERVAGWDNPQGGYFHVLHHHRWGDFHYVITGKDDKGGVVLEGGYQNNRRTGIHSEYRYVENIFEELTTAGEWFYDRSGGKLYVIFEAGVDPKDARVEVVVNEQLFRIVGTTTHLQRQVAFKNLTLTHTRRTFMKVAEPLLRSDWCIYRGGSLYFRNTCDCRVEDCNLVDMGSNAICVDGKNSGFIVSGSNIHDIAGNGICFIGDTDSVRSPLFEYNQRHHIGEIDMEPGPKSDNYPVNCQVTDCLITRTGRVEKQTAAIQISMASRVTVSHCSLYELPRAAINISEGNFGGHRIEHCDIFDTVLETGDHGSFNSWGRDRFWGLEGIDLNDLRRLELTQLPFLDAVEPTVIRGNRLRCDWGWDIDLDDGSSNYEIYNNLCLNGGIKLREGFGRKVWNNITVNNSLYAHVWYQDNGDIVYNNVFCSKYRQSRMEAPWGTFMDKNTVHDPLGSTLPQPAAVLQADSHRDENSIICNCLFRDPQVGDFTVLNPEVLATGFENFSMTHFGVLSYRLKKVARTPTLPVVRQLITGGGESRTDYFVHDEVRYKNITSLMEASAYGAGSTDGVIIAELRPSLELFARGLKTSDIILKVNDTVIKNIDDLKANIDLVTQPIRVEFTILREQEEMVI